jgi:hypothetical protein
MVLKKKQLGSPQKMFFPSVFLPRLFCSFFYRVLGRFVTRGVQKRNKGSSKTQQSSRQKNSKYLLTYVTAFFHGAP